MFFEQKVRTQCQRGIETLYKKEVPSDLFLVQGTRPEFAGTHTLILFGLSKWLAQKPQEVGDALGDWLVEEAPWLERYEVVGGFLNMVISDESWWQGLKAQQAGNEAMEKFRNKRILLEYSSPNTNKPLHLGHLRNIFLGEAVAHILEAVGAKVIRVQHINDRGIHICKSMVAYERRGRGRTPAEASMKGDHFVGRYYVAFERTYREEVRRLMAAGEAAERARKKAPLLQEAEAMLRRWEEGEEGTRALWKKMNQWVYGGFEATYRRLGISFDKTYYESETYLLGKKVVEEGLGEGLFYRKPDGSVWVDLAQEGLGEKLLLRGDGTAVYITQDLGTADVRHADFHFDQALYVVGNEQKYHFSVLFHLLKKLGREYAAKLHHLAYGMVDLPSGKMKSREGKVVDADDLIEEMTALARKRTEELGKVGDASEGAREQLACVIGLGALRYFLLRVGMAKRILFDPEGSIDFQGDTGPFVQYTYARIAALLRKGKGRGAAGGLPMHGDMPLAAVERELLQKLVGFQKALQQAADGYSPSFLVEYLYQLAKLYNRFYAELPVLKEGDERLRMRRLYFSQEAGRIIKRGMRLLGIEVPERM